LKSNSKKNEIRDTVRTAYAKIATTGASCCDSGGATNCCGTSKPVQLAEAVGYAKKELAALPEGANMGLSCGNPVAISSLKKGEHVLDLGAGGGFDIFIAAPIVGPKGHVIGVDMTPEMVSKARANAEIFRKRTGLDNAEFRLGEIEHLPLPDESVDVVISNCVINLSPDKPQVWREIARVLKPGGRVAVSDLALLKPLPKKVAESVSALVGCIAGAALIRDTKRFMSAAGLEKIEVDIKSDYMDKMYETSDLRYKNAMAELSSGCRMSDYVVSAYFRAVKPKKIGA
jgi:ubiquinone/menaquinone biosynthesis C-methylase UbiE